MKLGAVVASLFVLAGAAGCSSGDGHGKAAATTSTSVPTVTTATLSRTTSPRPRTAAPTSARAHVDIQLLRTNERGSHHLSLRTTVQGLVPQLYDDRDGTPVPGPDQYFNALVSFGDGSPENGSRGSHGTCKPDAPLVPDTHTFTFEHDYTAPGTYTVTYNEQVCQLGVVTKTTTITVV